MSLFSSTSPGVPRRATSGMEEGKVQEPAVQEFDDGRSFDPVAVHQSTQRWIATHMKKRYERGCRIMYVVDDRCLCLTHIGSSNLLNLLRLRYSVGRGT